MYETNDGGKNLIKRYLSVGYASAMLYLMGCSTTESDRGENSGYIYNSCEAEVEWDRWDKAQTFWTLLADSHQKVQAVLPAMAALVDVGKANDPFCLTTVIVKAWNLWINDKKIEQEDIECEIVEDDDGVYQLSELPNVGGIDIGKH